MGNNQITGVFWVLGNNHIGGFWPLGISLWALVNNHRGFLGNNHHDGSGYSMWFWLIIRGVLVKGANNPSLIPSSYQF